MAELKPKPSYPIAAKIKPPGPKYLIPPCVGFTGHTLTKDRLPAWTMRTQLKILDFTCSPGPAAHEYHPLIYNVGKVKGQSWIMGVSLAELKRFNVPGPASYTVLPDPTKFRSPAWHMALPGLVFKPNNFPGPNLYTIPPITGTKHPQFDTSPQFTMRPKLKIGGPYDILTKSPGPAGYSATDPDRTRTRQPIWTMRIKPEGLSTDKFPGPAAYFPALNHKQRSPAFTMRIKHSEYEHPIMVNENELLLDWD